MSERLDKAEAIHSALANSTSATLQLYLKTQGLPEPLAIGIAGLFIDVLPAITLFILRQRQAGMELKGRESIEADRIVAYLMDLGQLIEKNQLPLFKIDEIMETSPYIIDFMDRIIRNVEGETIRRKIRLQANLTLKVIAQLPNELTSQECQNYSNIILEMTPTDLQVLQRLVGIAYASGYRDHASFVQLKAKVGLSTKQQISIEIDPIDGISEAMLDQSISRLVSSGFIYEFEMSREGGRPQAYYTYRAEEVVRFNLNDNAQRFLSWCMMESESI